MILFNASDKADQILKVYLPGLIAQLDQLQTVTDELTKEVKRLSDNLDKITDLRD